ncbi:ADP-ribosylglycohydrolase family protein [Microscilla marina]|uniref:ADP-ribosylation/Crystallin J1 n=1 Tax=Microscilla marina ATCC 23134 TaxID=313606 RepID=A1ZWC4_MICM2|nr:ADP-ribosylglycohydrolase family protein [Microscilla marina]EAY25362.1 ADP-ribosylation/Crystallin J1 [Microscilla marina ATCC 23134]
METNPVINALLGVAMGDALGVPFEFRRSHQMKETPAVDMVGHGTHNQLAGTWSDDTSLTLCLAEALTKGYDLVNIAQEFIAWRYESRWTARGKLFDIGRTTAVAIAKLKSFLEHGVPEALSNQKGLGDDRENGNGSLMRIMPLLFYIKGKDIRTQFNIIWEVSALTHRHIRAAMSCLIYLKLGEHLLAGKDKLLAYEQTRKDVLALWEVIEFPESEKTVFEKSVIQDIRSLPRTDLKSGGYVIEALEASLWCFLTENSYAQAVFSVINLGHDTDTTGAITGGLAGLYYGMQDVPPRWHNVLARHDDIVTLGKLLYEKYGA